MEMLACRRWWWFVLFMVRKVVIVAIYLRGVNADDNYDWRLALVIALACFVCLELVARPYKDSFDNIMDISVMVVLIVVCAYCSYACSK